MTVHSSLLCYSIIFHLATSTNETCIISCDGVLYYPPCNAVFFYVYVTVNRNKFLFNKTNRRTNFPNLFLSRNSTYFRQFLCPSSGVPSWPCFKALIKPAWHIPMPNVLWNTSDDGHRNCPKHVEFLDKNKFGKLVRLLVLLKRDNAGCNFLISHLDTTVLPRSIHVWPSRFHFIAGNRWQSFGYLI